MVITKEKIFDRVRKLKAKGKTGTEIAKETGISEGTVYRIFSAIKHNLNSISEYHDYTIRRKINPETGKNFENVREYDNYIVRKNGFKDESSYVEFRNLLKTDEDKPRKLKQRGFERSIQLFPIERFERLIYKENNNELIEINDYLEERLKLLPDRLKTILEMRFYEGKTLGEIADNLKVSWENIQQLENSALEHLKYKTTYKEHYKIQDGELLLAHILSKSLENNDKTKLVKISNLINEIYHDEKDIRTKNSINVMLSNRYCKRIKELKDKYFPLS